MIELDPQLELMLWYWGCIPKPKPRTTGMNFTDALKTGKPITRTCWTWSPNGSRWKVWSDMNAGLLQEGETSRSPAVQRLTQADMLATDWAVKPDVLPWYHTVEQITRDCQFGPHPIGFKLKGFCATNITRRHHDFGRSFNMFHHEPFIRPSTIKVTVEYDDGSQTHTIQGIALGVELSERDGKTIETTS